MARPRSRTTDFHEVGGAISFALTQGVRALIDAGDDWVLNDRWYAFEANSNVYAATQRNGKRVVLHRAILRPPRGLVVDHFNGDTLDNRRWNLRLCLAADNSLNTTRKADAGIYWDASRKKWKSQIKWRGVRYYVGAFIDYAEAVAATQATRQSLMDDDPHFQGESGATDHSLLRLLRGDDAA